MDKNEMVERHKNRLKEIVSVCLHMFKSTFIPGIIKTVINLKKISSLLGISFKEFLALDDDELDTLYDQLPPETQEKIDALTNVTDDMFEDILHKKEACQKIMDEGEIVYNVINILDPDSNEDRQ